MDFSFQANAALDWVFSVMKAEDHLLILNVLNLKAPSTYRFEPFTYSLCARYCCQRKAEEGVPGEARGDEEESH